MTKSMTKAASEFGRRGGLAGRGAAKRRYLMTYRCETCSREIPPEEYEGLVEGEAMACPDHPQATILSCPDSSAYYRRIRARGTHPGMLLKRRY